MERWSERRSSASAKTSAKTSTRRSSRVGYDLDMRKGRGGEGGGKGEGILVLESGKGKGGDKWKGGDNDLKGGDGTRRCFLRAGFFLNLSTVKTWIRRVVREVDDE